MVHKYLLGWVLVTCSYVVTFLVSANIGAVMSANPQFLSTFVAAFMLAVPYIVSGFYARRVFGHTSGAAWVAAVPVLSERLLIFSIGRYYVSQRFNPGWNTLTVIHFIQAKTPAFYFSVPYIMLGIISILISVAIARRHATVR